MNNVSFNFYERSIKLLLLCMHHHYWLVRICGKHTETLVNTLRLRQNGRHFADDIFKCIFLNENMWISIGISLNFQPKGPINNIPALVQIMPWHWPGDKPFFEVKSLLTHICVTRLQWVKYVKTRYWLHTTVVPMKGSSRYNGENTTFFLFIDWNFTGVNLIMVRIRSKFYPKRL